MKQILKIICFLIVFLNISNAQQNVSAEDTDIVPIDTPLPDYPLSPTEACFDIDSVQANCTPIYINVNVHFFLNDSCTGQLATAPGEQTNLNPDNAFEVAEQLVNGANDFFKIMSDNTLGLNQQWNAAENGATVTEAQCLPFRYVLKGTRIHCNSSKQNIDTYYSEISNFIINGGFEMNVFITNVDGSANGFSSYNSNYIATEFVADDYGGNVFNHEMGHALNLSHTFETWENCVDIWRFLWKWDKNCDGINVLEGSNCWNSIHEYNGQDACDTTLFCQPHPCCDDTKQSNNLMTYSTWAAQPQYAALTPCQINKMLTNLATYKCNFIKVGGCPPPSAFVGIVPQPVGSTSCQTCFYLNASYNESSYELDILRPNGSKIISTGLLSGSAGKYCIKPKKDKWGNPYWPNGYVSGIEYTIRLKVYNECNEEDEVEYKFTLPALCQPTILLPRDTLKELIIESMMPNPASEYVTVKYTTTTSGQMKVYGMHLNTNNTYGILRNSAEVVAVNQEFTLDVSNWQVGGNALIFEYNGELYFEQLIKN